MQLSWRDSHDRTDPMTWRGLRLRVTDGTQPGLVVSASAPGRVRLATRATPLLWARVDADYWGYELLRAPRTQELAIVSPLGADMVSAHRETDAPLRAWATTFARLLQSSAHTPLYDGEWHLGALDGGAHCFELDNAVVKQIAAQKAHGYVQWDFGDTVYPITLRDMSAPDAGRVKAWRKQVKSGSLPPILLQWISGLAAYVILDGHDRLLAAALENAPAPAFALEPVRDSPPSEERQKSIVDAVEKSLAAAQRSRSFDERLARARRLFTSEDANRLLLDAFSPLEQTARSRAWQVPGGADQWVAEVRAALSTRSIKVTGLLDVDLSAQTRRHLNTLFAAADLAAAAEMLLSRCSSQLPGMARASPQSLERIRFAALRLSQGRLPDLERAIELAEADWRDLLVAANFAEDVTAHERWVPNGTN